MNALMHIIAGASAEEEAIELKKHVNSLPSRNRVTPILFTPDPR